MAKSPEVLEANFQNMEKRMEENQILNAQGHQEIKELLSDGINALSKKIDEINANKANKWVENGIRFIYVSAAVVFIGLLVRWIVLLEI